MAMIIIIEDEHYASEALIKTLLQADPGIEVKAIRGSVEDGVRNLSMGYILKPALKEDLDRALSKYGKLQKHFINGINPLHKFINSFGEKKKTRLIVRNGLEHVVLHIDDIALFYTENKIVYVLDKNGKEYMADKNLSDLEQLLDKNCFFRVNRQNIVHINYIRSFKAFERVKLQIELTLSDLNHNIIVSQETAPLFKKWMAGELFE